MPIVKFYCEIKTLLRSVKYNNNRNYFNGYYVNGKQMCIYFYNFSYKNKKQRKNIHSTPQG